MNDLNRPQTGGGGALDGPVDIQWAGGGTCAEHTAIVGAFDEARRVEPDIRGQATVLDQPLDLGFHADREYDQVMLGGITLIAFGIDSVENRIAVFRVFGNPGNFGFDEADGRILPDLGVKILETIDGADVDVIDGRFAGIAIGFADILGLFERGHATDPRAVAQIIFIAGAGALDEGDIFRFLAIRGAEQASRRRAMRVGQPFEFDTGDDIGVAIVAIGLDLIGVKRPPAGRPNNRADRELKCLLLHAQVDGIVAAGGLGSLALIGADDGRVDDVALRIGHGMGEVSCLDFAQTVVEGIGDFAGYDFAAIAAGGAVFVDIARGDFERNVVVAALTSHRSNFGHRHHFDIRVALDALQIDFQAAGWMAHLGKIAIELGGTAAQRRIFFHQDHFFAAFCGFEGGGHAADAAADDQDRLIGCDRSRHS